MSNGYVTAGHPAHAAILTRPAPRIVETWLATGMPIWKRYPCACRLGLACNTNLFGDSPPCRCWGRTDPDLTISHCCAARAYRLARKDQT